MPSEPSRRQELEKLSEKALHGGDPDAALAYGKQMRDDEPLDPELASNFLFKLHFLNVPNAALFMEHRRYGELFEPHGRRILPPHAPKPNGKIRIGYLSPDLYMQASHYVLLPILKNHDRSRFEIYTYSTHPAHDAATEEIKRLSDAWRNAWHTDYDSLIDMITHDEIDILVDLAGHTGINSLPVFAERAAPIQVSWFGYMNTSGLLNMDYRITDEWRTPKSEQHLYTEKLAYLPNSYTFMPAQTNIELTAPPSLTEQFVTFGSLNSTTKLNPDMLTIWTRILNEVSNSRLMLLACESEEQGEAIRNFFAQRSIDSSRVETKTRMSLDNFLSHVDDIDIALDTFPYTGGVTTYHALSRGVPTITLEGTREYARNCAAILHEAGLHEWIAKTKEEYLTKAVWFSSQKELLSSLRTRLPSELISREGSIVHHIEQLFIEMQEQKRREHSR